MVRMVVGGLSVDVVLDWLGGFLFFLLICYFPSGIGFGLAAIDTEGRKSFVGWVLFWPFIATGRIYGDWKKNRQYKREEERITWTL